jgi:Lon protease-like protein
VERIPGSNPFTRFRERFPADLERLQRKEIGFDDYAFANVRQFGAAYELAATWLRWLAAQGISSVEPAAEGLQSIAEGAKAFQFQLARAVARGKPIDAAPIEAMAARWDGVMEPLRKRLA